MKLSSFGCLIVISCVCHFDQGCGTTTTGRDSKIGSINLPAGYGKPGERLPIDWSNKQMVAQVLPLLMADKYGIKTTWEIHDVDGNGAEDFDVVYVSGITSYENRGVLLVAVVNLVGAASEKSPWKDKVFITWPQFFPGGRHIIAVSDCAELREMLKSGRKDEAWDRLKTLWKWEKLP